MSPTSSEPRVLRRYANKFHLCAGIAGGFSESSPSCDLRLFGSDPDEGILCHRMVLSLVSGRLRGLLAATGHLDMATVVVPDAEASDLRAFVRGVYDAINGMKDLDLKVGGPVYECFGLRESDRSPKVVGGHPVEEEEERASQVVIPVGASMDQWPSEVLRALPRNRRRRGGPRMATPPWMLPKRAREPEPPSPKRSSPENSLPFCLYCGDTLAVPSVQFYARHLSHSHQARSNCLTGHWMTFWLSFLSKCSFNKGS